MADELKRDKEDVIYTRRAAKRIDVELEVSFEVVAGGPHTFYTGITQDISHGGIFLGTHQTMPIGHKMYLTFILEEREIKAHAEVVWVREPDLTAAGIQPGMGLRFTEIAEADRKFIEDYAAQRETIYYDDNK